MVSVCDNAHGKMATNKRKNQHRKLDSAAEATIDLVALNNTVVNMRSVVKAAKVQVIHKLSRMIQKLKNKKGTEQQKEKNHRKAQRMLDEIFAIKELNVDSVTKFALANKATYGDIAKQPSASTEARSLMRLSEHRLLASKVKAFREAHGDWEELAAYLTTKQTGRRFRTKEQKQRAARKGSKFVCPLDVEKISGECTVAVKDGGKLASAPQQGTEEKSMDADSVETSAGTAREQGRKGREDSKLHTVRTDRQQERTVTASPASDHEDVNGDDSPDLPQSDEEVADSGSGNSAADVNGDNEGVNADEDSDGEASDADGSENGDSANVKSNSDNDAVETDSEADQPGEDDGDSESDQNDNEHDQNDSDSDQNDNEHDQNDSDSDLNDSEDQDDAAMAHDESDVDSGKHDSDDEDDSGDSGPRALSLLRKAPTTSALVEDPFFVGDGSADSDQPHHWIEQDTVEKMDFRAPRRGGHPKAGRGGRPPRGGHAWTHRERSDDDRWLRGDEDTRQFGRGRGRGRGHRDHQRGRGTFSARRGSSRGRGGQGRGDNSGFQGHSSRGRGRGWRKEGSNSSSFNRQHHSDNVNGQRRKDKPFQQRGRGGRDESSRQAFKKPPPETGKSASKAEDPSSHPSWDAHRKRKQLEQTATFTGKHIKFDDD